MSSSAFARSFALNSFTHKARERICELHIVVLALFQAEHVLLDGGRKRRDLEEELVQFLLQFFLFLR